MATKEDGVEVEITGKSDQVEAAMKAAADAVNGGVGKIKGAFDELGGAFSKINGMFVALAGIAAGGKFFKDAISESNKLTGETMKLSKQLDITAEEAGVLNTALGDIYSDSDTYIGAYQKFASQLRKNEDGLRAMGLETRDAAGHLRNANDVFQEAIKLPTQYKAGLDQQIAAQKLFGKSVDDVMKLQKLNNDVLDQARQKNEELGLTITQQNVEASKEYKAAMNDLGDVMTAVQKTVGDAVMPVFTELANYLASTGPYVVAVFKGAMTGLLLVFRSVQAVVKTVAAVIFEFISGTIDQVGNLSDLISAVLSGNFSKAAESAVRMKDRIVTAFRNVKDAAVENFGAAGEAFGADLERVWGPKVASTSKPKGGAKQLGDLKDQKEDKELPKVDAELAAAKLKYAMENDLREMSKAQELATFEELVAKHDLSEKEKVVATKRATEMKLAVLRDERQQIIDLSEEAIEAYKQQRLDAVESDRMAARLKADTAQITAQELLQIEQQLEDQRYQIVRDAVQARLAVLAQDPTKNVVALQKLNDELAAVEREHQLKVKGIQAESQREQLKDYQSLFDGIGNSFGGVVKGIVSGTMSMSGAVKSLFSGLLSSVAGFLGQMIAKKVAAWAAEKALAAGTIATNAAVAGSGAAASQAMIPIAGPGLALAAMAAIFAAVMGLGGKGSSSVPSARNGFDIPSGLNPLTQLHEEEMVLPKEQADVIRGMDASNQQPIIIPTTGGDFIHKDQLASLLRKLGRDFAYTR